MANTANNAAGVPRQPRGNSGQQNNSRHGRWP